MSKNNKNRNLFSMSNPISAKLSNRQHRCSIEYQQPCENGENKRDKVVREQNGGDRRRLKRTCSAINEEHEGANMSKKYCEKVIKVGKDRSLSIQIVLNDHSAHKQPQQKCDNIEETISVRMKNNRNITIQLKNEEANLSQEEQMSAMHTIEEEQSLNQNNQTNPKNRAQNRKIIKAKKRDKFEENLRSKKLLIRDACEKKGQNQKLGKFCKKKTNRSICCLSDRNNYHQNENQKKKNQQLCKINNLRSMVQRNKNKRSMRTISSYAKNQQSVPVNSKKRLHTISSSNIRNQKIEATYNVSAYNRKSEQKQNEGRIISPQMLDIKRKIHKYHQVCSSSRDAKGYGQSSITYSFKNMSSREKYHDDEGSSNKKYLLNKSKYVLLEDDAVGGEAQISRKIRLISESELGRNQNKQKRRNTVKTEYDDKEGKSVGNICDGQGKRSLVFKHQRHKTSIYQAKEEEEIQQIQDQEQINKKFENLPDIDPNQDYLHTNKQSQATEDKKNIKEELNINKNNLLAAHHNPGYVKNHFKSYMEYIKNRKRDINLNKVKIMRNNGGNASQNSRIGDLSHSMANQKEEKKDFEEKGVTEQLKKPKAVGIPLKQHHSKSVGMYQQQKNLQVFEKISLHNNEMDETVVQKSVSQNNHQNNPKPSIRRPLQNEIQCSSIERVNQSSFLNSVELKEIDIVKNRQRDNKQYVINDFQYNLDIDFDALGVFKQKLDKNDGEQICQKTNAKGKQNLSKKFKEDGKKLIFEQDEIEEKDTKIYQTNFFIEQENSSDQNLTTIKKNRRIIAKQKTSDHELNELQARQSKKSKHSISSSISNHSFANRLSIKRALPEGFFK